MKPVIFLICFFFVSSTFANVNYYPSNNLDFSNKDNINAMNYSQNLKTDFTKKINIQKSNTDINNKFHVSDSGYGFNTQASLSF